MRLTPLDIQNHRVSKRLRGLDPAEVESFLQLVAEDYEALIRQCDAQSATLRDLEARVAELSSAERTLHDTLLTAQALSDDLKRTAMRESEVRVSEAEVKAERILDAAHRRAARLADDIREMKLLRARLAAAVRSAIETHLHLLEGLSTEAPEDDPSLAAAEGKVAFLGRPPKAVSGSGET